MTESRLLGDLLEQAHDGHPWHGPSRGALLADVEAATAAARPVRTAHSIWELVLHMTAWTREVARRLRSGMAREPDMGDWPSVGAVGDSEWLAARRALDAAHAELVAAVLAIPDDRLGARVRDERPGETGGVTLRDTVVGVLQHDAYHCGQIALLKKSLASAGGSDPAHEEGSP